LASLFLPDVIRIPARWPPRLPRVEMVHGGKDSAQVAVAATPPAPETAVPKDTVAPKVDTVALESAALAASPILDTAISERRNKLARLPKKPAPKPRPARHVEEALRPETPEEAAWFQQEPTMTIVPVKVTTEVRLTSPTAADSAPPVPGNVPGQDWPIVCGVVVDSTGAAVEGASVEVDSSVETEHTDAK